MGTSARRFAVPSRQRRDPWPDVQNLVLAEVKKPTSIWAGYERAVHRVQALIDVRSLIEACREAWRWTGSEERLVLTRPWPPAALGVFHQLHEQQMIEQADRHHRAAEQDEHPASWRKEAADWGARGETTDGRRRAG
jgi:hypothetical protein